MAAFCLATCPAGSGSECDAVVAVLGVSGIESESWGPAAHVRHMLRARARGGGVGRYERARVTPH